MRMRQNAKETKTRRAEARSPVAVACDMRNSIDYTRALALRHKRSPYDYTVRSLPLARPRSSHPDPCSPFFRCLMPRLLGWRSGCCCWS